MGKGSSPAGTTPAGYDPSPSIDGTDYTPPWAPYIDGAQMDVPINDDGLYLEVHPVDHEVEMAILNEFGTIPTSQDIGAEFSTLPIDTDQVMTAEARRRADRALAELIRRKDIQLIEVRAYSRVNGRAHLDIRYRNLRLTNEDDPTRTLRIQ